MRKTLKLQKVICLCGGKCCKEHNLSAAQSTMLNAAIHSASSPLNRNVYGCGTSGTRYILVNGHWVALGGGCKGTDIPVQD